jgi:hypothetical protein
MQQHKRCDILLLTQTLSCHLSSSLHNNTYCRSMPQDDLIQLLNERMDSKFAKRDAENGDRGTRQPFQLGPRDLSEAITTMNDMLDKYRMQMQVVARKFFEVDNIKYWTLISTSDDDIVRATGAKALKEWQLVLLKQTLDAIVDSSIGFVHAGEVMSKSKRPNQEVEAFLAQMVEDKWLAKGQRAGMFTAGIRSLTELADYMKAMGAHMCKVNNIPVVRTSVYKRKFEGGDDDDDDDDDEAGAQEDQSPSASGKKRKARGSRRVAAPVDDDDDDDDDDDEEEEEEEEEETPTTRRRSSRRRS